MVTTEAAPTEEIIARSRPQIVPTNGDISAQTNGGTHNKLPNIMVDGDDPRWKLLPTRLVTFEEYQHWTQTTDEKRAEWEDGRIVLLPMVSDQHQDLVWFLNSLMRFWIQLHKISGKVSFGPFAVRVSAKQGREPDVMYMRADIAPERTMRSIPVAPDIAVEIVSENGQKHDYETKYLEYQSAGVREYWIIDPLVQETRFYRRNDLTGKFERVVLIGENATIFRSTVLAGLEIDTDWFWKDELPDVLEIVRQWDAATQPSSSAEAEVSV